MAMVSVLVFGGALSAASWSMWTTVRPEMARIVDLLVHGPVVTPMLPVPVAARSMARAIRMRPVLSPAPRRAAA